MPFQHYGLVIFLGMLDSSQSLLADLEAQVVIPLEAVNVMVVIFQNLFTESTGKHGDSHKK